MSGPHNVSMVLCRGDYRPAGTLRNIRIEGSDRGLTGNSQLVSIVQKIIASNSHWEPFDSSNWIAVDSVREADGYLIVKYADPLIGNAARFIIARFWAELGNMSSLHYFLEYPMEPDEKLVTAYKMKHPLDSGGKYRCAMPDIRADVTFETLLSLNEIITADKADKRQKKIAGAIKSLDAEEPAHWTRFGLPRAKAVEIISGAIGVTRKEIEAAVPGWTSESAILAFANPSMTDEQITAFKANI